MFQSKISAVKILKGTNETIQQKNEDDTGRNGQQEGESKNAKTVWRTVNANDEIRPELLLFGTVDGKTSLRSH